MIQRSKVLTIASPLIVILICLLFYQYVYVRVHGDLAAISEEQAMKKKTLDKYINLIAEKPQLEEKLASLKEERKAQDSKFMTGDTQALAAATLQETVKGIITGRGGSVSSERVGKSEESGKFKVISVSIDAVLPDPRALGDILYSLETRTPYLIVKELDTRIRNYREPRDVMVKLDITALHGGK